MQTGQGSSSPPQQPETEARRATNSPTGTAAPALGPPQQLRLPPSERCSSAPPTHSLGPAGPQQQPEAEQAAAAQTGSALLRPASAPPHAPSDREAGGQEPALLLEMLADEACHASSVATDVSHSQQQQAGIDPAASMPDASEPAPAGQGGPEGAAPPLAAAPLLVHGGLPPLPAPQLSAGQPHMLPAAAAPAAARALPNILQQLLGGQSLRAGLQQLGLAAAAHQPAAAVQEWNMLEVAAAAAAAAGTYPHLPPAQLALGWQPGWRGPQAMQVDAAPHLQPQPGSARAAAALQAQQAAAAAAVAAAAEHGGPTGHSHRAAHGHQSATHGHQSSHSHRSTHSKHASPTVAAAAAHGHHTTHGKRSSPTAAASAAAAAAAVEAAQATQASMQRVQKWQMAAQIALQSLGAPPAAEDPSPRPQLARHYSAVTSRELGSKDGSGWPGSPSAAQRSTALKRSVTDLQAPRAAPLLSPHSTLQANDPARWIQELGAGDRGAKRQAVAPAGEASAPVAVPAGGGPPAPQQRQQQQQQRPDAGKEGTGGKPSAGPSRAPSGDSFAFPPKREATPPTPKTAAAMAAEAVEAAGAAAAAAGAAPAARAAPAAPAGAPHAAAAAPAYVGPHPAALPGLAPAPAAAGAMTDVAMHRAAMLALQADALHRLRREFSKLQQLEMLISMLDRDLQHGSSPTGASPITPQLLPQPLGSAQMSLQQPLGSAQMSLQQPLGSAQMSLQQSGSVPMSVQQSGSGHLLQHQPGSGLMSLQQSGSSHLALQPPGSTRITLQPSSSMRLVLPGLGSPHAALGTPHSTPLPPAAPLLPAAPQAPRPALPAAGGAAGTAGTAGSALAGELGSLLAAMQRAGMRPEEVGQLQTLAAYLQRMQGSPRK